MDLTAQVDAYCERTDLTFWSEPLNALTNLAFLIAAIWMWRRSQGVPAARVLCAILFAIGVGSFLFHTFATGWAALADVVPIGLFILVYLFLVHRDVLGFPLWLAILGTAMFAPFAAIAVPVLDQIPFLRISNFYWTVPILLFAYAPFVARKDGATAQGMVIGAVLLCVSITTRSVDEMLCHHWPTGTHIGWHILNAIMLGWMIEVYRCHMGRVAARMT